jgi:carbon-monoxide dehydrogenase medium subunit
VAPTTIPDALDHLSRPGAVALAGGCSMAIMLKSGLVGPETLVYLGRIPGLRARGRGDGGLHLGAGVTLRELARSPAVVAVAPMLARTAGRIGNPRVRSVATIGGAAVHADGRLDLPPVLMALGASVRVESRRGSRHVPLDSFYTGFLRTVLADDELVTEVLVPADPARLAAYARFTPGSHHDYPTVGVAVSLSLRPDGTIDDARVALSGVAATAVLAPESADQLRGKPPGPAVFAAAAAAAAASADPNGDRLGSADYKRAMIEVWTRRALEVCLRP